MANLFSGGKGRAIALRTRNKMTKYVIPGKKISGISLEIFFSTDDLNQPTPVYGEFSKLILM
ncbi:hypothetical protein HY439_00305 [Candidatus Microgenomates bacterium]|nr:hypothetical protein [Candidatus Microgenomates bacterium]